MIMSRATLNRVSGKVQKAFQLRPRQSSEQTLTKETPQTAIFVSLCQTEKIKNNLCILTALDVSQQELELFIKCHHD